jgi:hypothetical protein
MLRAICAPSVLPRPFALPKSKPCKIMYRMRRFIFYVSMVFSKDIFSAIYMKYIKGFVPIRYRGYCLCISPHLILIYLQARVFQQTHIE